MVLLAIATALVGANVSLDAAQTDQAACAAELEARGGYLPYSRMQQSCLGLGRPGPARDVTDDELATLREWCPKDRWGPACVSLSRVCNLYGEVGGDTWPNLTAACAVMKEAWNAPMPKDPGIREMWTGFGGGDVDDPAMLGGASSTFAADVSMHGIVGLNKVAPGVLMNLAAGSTDDGGFLYRFATGVGVGVRLGDDGIVTATIGGGLSGITGGRLGFALEIPVQVTATLPVGPRLRVMFASRGSWVFRENPRQDGFPDMPLYDEIDARAGLAYRTSAGALFGVYGFVQHLRETAIVGVALAIGHTELITPPARRPTTGP